MTTFTKSKKTSVRRRGVCSRSVVCNAGRKKSTNGEALRMCSAGSRGYINRTSLWVMIERIAGISKETDASWNRTEAFSFAIDGVFFRVRYKPTTVNGSAVVRRRGYPCEA